MTELKSIYLDQLFDLSANSNDDNNKDPDITLSGL